MARCAHHGLETAIVCPADKRSHLETANRPVSGQSRSAIRTDWVRAIWISPSEPHAIRHRPGTHQVNGGLGRDWISCARTGRTLFQATVRVAPWPFPSRSSWPNPMTPGLMPNGARDRGFRFIKNRWAGASEGPRPGITELEPLLGRLPHSLRFDDRGSVPGLRSTPGERAVIAGLTFVSDPASRARPWGFTTRSAQARQGDFIAPLRASTSPLALLRHASVASHAGVCPP